MEVPVVFRVYMDEPAADLAEVYADAVPDETRAFIERRQVAVHGTEAGAVALQVFGQGREIRRVETDTADLWKGAKADEWNAPIGGDTRTLEKRIGDSTRRANLTEFVKRRLATGATVAELAKYAEAHDAETANLIREIGAEL